MSVTIRDYPGGRKEVDIRFRLPNGNWFRRKLVAPMPATSAARRWGEARERDLYEKATAPGRATAPSTVPTLEQFVPRFIEEYARANQHKASGIASKHAVFDRYLLPRFGAKRLNEFTDADVAKLKAELKDLSPKTVNNVLSVLSKALKVAVDWGVLMELPVHIRLLKVQEAQMTFYEPRDFARLVAAAADLGADYELLVRLGGDLGLRRGEIIAIRDADVDLARGVVTIQRNVVLDQEGGTKGLKARRIPIPDGLRSLLVGIMPARRGHLLQDAGERLTPKKLRVMMRRVQTKADLTNNGALHILRHTYCSHLAMAGVPVMEIQRLAGHAHLTTTLKYMHLSPGSEQREAVAKLDRLRQFSGDSK